MPSGPSGDDDDDDSVYSSQLLPDPTSHAADDTILNPSSPRTRQLDDCLDADDAQHLRDNPHLADSDFDSDNVPSSDCEPDQDDEDDGPGDGEQSGKRPPRKPRVQVLSSPPRYPDAPGLDGDLHFCAGLELDASVNSRFEKSLRLHSDSGEDVGRSDGVVVLDADDEDDWFDSDENQVDVESLDSSDASTDAALDDPKLATPGPLQGNATARDAPVSEATRAADKVEGDKPRPSGGGGVAYSLLSRASQTFYKAFKKSSKKTGGTSTSNGEIGGSRGGAGTGTGEKVSGKEETVRHERMIQLLDAQIATLNGARTGFVDLNLLKPMTEKTIEAIEGEGKALLRDYVAVEKRGREVEKEAGQTRQEAEEELEAKEQMLINAKVRLAEVSAEVDGLRHELRTLQRSLEAPERVEAGVREERRKRREGMGARLVAGREARVAAEERLEGQKRRLKMEQGQLERLEKGYRDIEGDWA